MKEGSKVPRRGNVPKREILPDPIYGSVLVTKLVNSIMKVCVIVPDEYMGDVIGDITSRRGNVQGLTQRNGAQQIDCFVPLSEMFGYATNLRSRTQGRGQFTMEPSHYIELPKSLTDGIVSKRKGN